jgi:hypothetical protein
MRGEDTMMSVGRMTVAAALVIGTIGATAVRAAERPIKDGQRIAFPGASITQAGAGTKGKVRLLILAGQSNMVYLDESKSLTPTIKKAFPEDEVIVVKYAQGGTPIRLWFKGWKAPEGADEYWTKDKERQGSLYDTLMEKVTKAIEGKTPDTVSFVWMQGERDAKGGVAASYEDGLRGLIRKVREDMKRDDVTIVIGRLRDHRKNEKHWDTVRAIQEKVAKEDPRAAWVDTDTLNGPNNDLHYSKEGFVELGRLFAEETIKLLSK